jgi:hypothetical protein
VTHIIPTTIIDNFFDDPYAVRQFGLQFSKEIQIIDIKNNIAYRGKRSDCLSEIHPHLFNLISKKFFSSFYDLSSEKIEWVADIRYQLTDGSFGPGWVHKDSPALITGIIYLNPGASIESGTSLYQPKNIACKQLYENIKKDANQNIDLRNSEYYVKCREENNSQFVETVRVNNIFNRLVAFDSSVYHCGTNFFGETAESSRLTIVFFIHKLIVNQTPITRIKIQN